MDSMMILTREAWTIIGAILGAVMGSFISAMAYRIPRGLPIGNARSACTQCGHTLKARELIPLLSWALQKGKCASCKTPIHILYPATELGLALGWAWMFFLYPNQPESWIYGLLLTHIFLLIWIDLEHMILPDSIQLSFALLGIIQLLLGLNPWVDGISASLIAGLGTWALATIYGRIRRKDVLGLGDVKLFAHLGLWLTPESLPLFFLLSGLIGIMIGMAWRPRGTAFPFAPAILAAFLATLILSRMNNVFPLDPTLLVVL